MSKKIIGYTVGTTLPKPSFAQTDPKKGDYIKDKEVLDTQFVKLDAQELTEEQKAQARINIGAEDEVYILQDGETDANAPDTAVIIIDPTESEFDGELSGGAYVEIANNLTTSDPSMVLSAAQGVVLKGLIDELDEKKESVENKSTELTAESTDEQYPSAKAVYDALSNITIEVDTTLTEEGKAADAKSVGEKITLLEELSADVAYINEEDNENITDVETGGVANITVDSALSTTSTNPVQNKVITDKVSQFETAIAGLTTSMEDINRLSAEIADLESDLEALTSAKAEGSTLEEQIAWLEASGDITKEYLLVDGYYYAYGSDGSVQYTNLFSFENANENFSQISGTANNAIYETSADFGYKDTANNRFVSKKSTENGRFAITGGLPVLPAGNYTVTAEAYMPSDGGFTKAVNFGAMTIPSDYRNQYGYMNLSAYDTWETVTRTFVIAEGDVATYVALMSAGTDHEMYWRNVTVISETDEGTAGVGWYKTDKTVSSVGTGTGAKKWKSKKWVAFGDSLTESNIRTTKSYHGYIADETGISVKNMGYGGSGFKRLFESNQAYFQRILNVPTDADVVTIMASGNDLSTIWNTFGLGNVVDTGTDTICGCINATIDNLYSVIPTVRLGIITPTPWDVFYPSATEDPQNRMTLYSNAIVEICKRRGIPCLDLYHCSALRPWEPSFKALAYTKDDGGGTHPDETGHAIIAPRIKAFLESLIL